MASGMIEGKWTTGGNKPEPRGKFKETPTTFRDRTLSLSGLSAIKFSSVVAGTGND